MLKSQYASASATELQCYHCGDTCTPKDAIHHKDKVFCCQGCQTVYDILAEKDLCTYYDLATEGKAGIKLKHRNFGEKFAFLDNPDIARRLLYFDSPQLQKITFYLPAMHCSSCIWLLENLYQLRQGISYSRVNFMRKELTISYNPQEISLRTIAELLTTLGYEPQINLDSLNQQHQHKIQRRLIYQIGVTGFCMGNIMLLSFPDYLVIQDKVEDAHKYLFLLISVVLSLPVFFYGASDYLISAYKALKARTMNLDVPISLGIVSLFGRSLYEMLTYTGVGYMDSLATLVFLLLVGKWFQQKTYASLSFERDYKSYFPLAVAVQEAEGKVNTKLVTDLRKDDIIIIHNQELVPTDSILVSEQAYIDYSFVTGEATPVLKEQGDYIYAGGRQIGANISLAVQKEVAQSYLTQLWNSDNFQKNTEKEKIDRLVQLFSHGFIYITFSIAILTWLFWFWTNPAIMWNAFTAVLIVACPCALSLAMPFTFGNIIRILGKNQFYLKNIEVINRLANLQHIVFDKTGTLTNTQTSRLVWHGKTLDATLQSYIKTLCEQSIHPLSKKIVQYFGNIPSLKLDYFEEITGQGIKGIVQNFSLKIGSNTLNKADVEANNTQNFLQTQVHVWVNEQHCGYFSFQHEYRAGLAEVLKDLQQTYQLSVVSGDRAEADSNLQDLLGNASQVCFNQKPEQKLAYIKQLQARGQKVAMIGDGLNDAGALQQAEVGIALAEDTLAFSPACDAILAAEKFRLLPNFIRTARKAVWAVQMSFWLSIFYNIIGLSWAISGNLSPLVAAIFMPFSSITVVGFGVLLSNYIARKAGLQV